jgi:hypothetical protein
LIPGQFGLKAFPAEMKFFQAINNPGFMRVNECRQSIQSCAGCWYEMDEARFAATVPVFNVYECV